MERISEHLYLRTENDVRRDDRNRAIDRSRSRQFFFLASAVILHPSRYRMYGKMPEEQIDRSVFLLPSTTTVPLAFGSDIEHLIE